ncbi:MAG: hypothetical protein ACI9S8_003222, partial [Chlamydiales bacterium]
AKEDRRRKRGECPGVSSQLCKLIIVTRLPLQKKAAPLGGVPLQLREQKGEKRFLPRKEI